jgi:hypothetical protein
MFIFDLIEYCFFLILGEVYPWYNPRLPENLKPLSYEIEIFVTEFGIPLYDGYDSISIEVTKPTQYIILHTKLELLVFNGLTDKNGNNISISCAGEFPTFDYLISKDSLFFLIKLIFLIISHFCS